MTHTRPLGFYLVFRNKHSLGSFGSGSLFVILILVFCFYPKKCLVDVIHQRTVLLAKSQLSESLEKTIIGAGTEIRLAPHPLVGVLIIRIMIFIRNSTQHTGYNKP